MTVAVACELGFAVLVAVILTLVLLLTLGATKAPVLEIVPTLADHVTAVLEVPLIWAVNCCLPSEVTVALVGEITTAMLLEILGETTIRAEAEPCATLSCVFCESAPYSPCPGAETEITKV